MKDFLAELQWRGLVQDHTPELPTALAQTPCVAYIGYDPTAPSLTIGNLVTIMLLVHFQRCGHQPIVVLGGATGRIGDPSGKDKERQLLSIEQLEENIERQALIFQRLLSFEGDNAAIVINNYDFYRDMNVLAFLRDVGKNITVSYMLAKDSVKNRLEGGLSFTEFSYQLLQGYDFQCLYHQYQCSIQMGGSDQWGNMTTGMDFVRRNGGKANVLTCPLLTTADGKKIGKSEEGSIYLSAPMTSPYKFYQYWLNAADADMYRLLRTFSLKERDEIEALEAASAADPNQWKRDLAKELTERLHGSEACQAAVNASEILFNPRMSPETLRGLEAAAWEALQGEAPTFQVPRATITQGSTIVDLLAVHTNILSSKSEARKAIQGNAVSLNKLKISDSERAIGVYDLLNERYLLIENGKKNKYLVVVE